MRPSGNFVGRAIPEAGWGNHYDVCDEKNDPISSPSDLFPVSVRAVCVKLKFHVAILALIAARRCNRYRLIDTVLSHSSITHEVTRQGVGLLFSLRIWGLTNPFGIGGWKVLISKFCFFTTYGWLFAACMRHYSAHAIFFRPTIASKMAVNRVNTALHLSVSIFSV